MRPCPACARWTARLGVALVFAGAFGTLDAAAGDGTGEDPVWEKEEGGHLMEWRRSLQAEIKYAPAAPAKARAEAAAPPAEKKPPPERVADPDTYQMPPFVVEAKPVNFRRLDDEISAGAAATAEQRKSESIGRKLGIGVHTAHFRHMDASVVTIFFIPIAVGLSW